MRISNNTYRSYYVNYNIATEFCNELLSCEVLFSGYIIFFLFLFPVLSLNNQILSPRSMFSPLWYFEGIYPFSFLILQVLVFLEPAKNLFVYCQNQGTKNNTRSCLKVVSLLLLAHRLISCQTKAVICIATRYTLQTAEGSPAFRFRHIKDSRLLWLFACWGRASPHCSSGPHSTSYM